MAIKMVCSDIDGTLLQYGKQELEGEIFEQIRALHQRGILFCPASGRQYTSLRKLFAPVADCCVFLCENGGVIYKDGQCIAKNPMPRALAEEIANDLWDRSNGQGEVMLSGQNTAYLMERGLGMLDRIRFIGNNYQIICTPSEVPEEIVKVSVYLHEGVDAYVDRFVPRWQQANCAVAGPFWIDTTLANKGIGITSICRTLGMDPAEVMAFGDNYNDVTMLDLVGHPYIMDGAAAPLREKYPNHTPRPEDVLRTFLAQEERKNKKERPLSGRTAGVLCRWQRKNLLQDGHEPLDRLGVVVGEEQALAAVQRLNGGHILGGKGEIKQVKVLLHPLLVDGFRDDDHIALQQEAQSRLGCSLAVLGANGRQGRIGEHILAALGKGTPGFDLAAVLFQVFFGCLLLLEDVSLNLVDGGLHSGKVLDVQVAVRAEVGHADGADLAGVVELLHCAVGAVVIAERLMDEQQVQIIGAQFAHGFLNGGLGFFIAGIGDPYLGGEEELFPGQAALGQGSTHAFLIAVGLGCVNAAVADLDGIQHTALGILRRGLVNAVAQLGHFDAVVQCNVFHGFAS